MENMNNINNMNNIIHMDNNMDGGKFILDNMLRKFRGESNIAEIIKKTKKSELSLLSSYEDMYSKNKQYNLAYDNHLKNIIMLDDKLNFNGMETLFKKIIMKNILKDGKVDKSIPLLFRNYLIKGDVTISEYIKEHILRQVEYILNKYFASREHKYIKNIEISNITKEDFQCTLLTLDNIEKKYKINHSNYIIDKNETKSVLNKILSATKKNFKRNSVIQLIKNTKNDISHKSHKRSHKSHNRSHKSHRSNKTHNDDKKSKSRKTYRLSILNTKSHTKSNTKSNTKSHIKSTSKSKHKKKDNDNKSKSNISMIDLDIKSIGKSRSRSRSRSRSQSKSVKSITNETHVKPPQRQKLSLFMTKSEKRAANPPQMAQPMGTIGQQQTVQFGSPIPNVDTRALQLLTQGSPTIGQPLQQDMVPLGQPQSTDPEDIRCNTGGHDYDSCKSLGGCHWKFNKCNKNVPIQQTSFTPAVNPFALPANAF